MTKGFPNQETFGLTSQLRRASVSIAANLAEGCGKSSNKGTANFFQIALGSLHETEDYLLLAKDHVYMSAAIFEERDQEIREVKAMLVALIKAVRNSQKGE